jgi:alpha-ketoglutarate-dependent taurine dioxygenase
VKEQETQKLPDAVPGAGRRKTISVSQEGLARLSYLDGEKLPLVIQPAMEGVDLRSWCVSQRQFIEAGLLKHGAILFRQFGIHSPTEFEDLIKAVCGELLDYSYASTPRSQVAGKVYTSTEYPPDQSIPLHNEMSYASNWPMKIWFLCINAAERGGETPLADSRKVFQRIAPEVRDVFQRKQVMYVRNYNDVLDLPWQSVFQTTDKSVVESYCRQAGIEFEWQSNDRLKTWQVCPATATHPHTGEQAWFNQAHLFHVSSLKTEVRESLLATFAEEELPRNAYHGDGSPIDPAMLDEVREAYLQEEVTFPWRAGDILLLDNVLAAHGRRPYTPPRRIVVGMAEPC